jgi:hypothetical protein
LEFQPCIVWYYNIVCETIKQWLTRTLWCCFGNADESNWYRTKNSLG